MSGKVTAMARSAHWIACMALAAAAMPVGARARSAEKTLYSFSYSVDGELPVGGIASDANGALYGTTSSGGVNTYGTVFRLTPAGDGHYDASVLYALTGGLDGIYPQSVPLLDQAGNLYATSASGPGSVFELKPAKSGEWNLRRTYQFTAFGDGATPVTGVIMDANRNLFGTTAFGGAYGYGTVYELSPAGNGWREKMRYDFTGKNDGYFPHSGVIEDSAGNLYGTAIGGQYLRGVVFELSPGPSGWQFTILHTFNQNADGNASDPNRTLAFGKSGKLYGTTETGFAQTDVGEVFELTPPKKPDGKWPLRVLYTFASAANGANPSGPLYVARNGALYGTTAGGGNQNCTGGCGVVFKLTPTHNAESTSWEESVLWSFTGGPDGNYPGGSLASCGPGQLCGTASEGGAFAEGTVFKISE